MQARIYKPSKNAMQSGKTNTKQWILEFIEATRPIIDPVMGWTSSIDMNQEVIIKFSSKESAINFAEKNNIVYELIEPQKSDIIIKSYADNFRK
jgi:hypothetical protein